MAELTQIVHLRLTPQLWHAVQRAARADGRKPSGYVRRAVELATTHGLRVLEANQTATNQDATRAARPTTTRPGRVSPPTRSGPTFDNLAEAKPPLFHTDEATASDNQMINHVNAEQVTSLD